MKKFFTNVPLQGENQLKSVVYQPVGNERFTMEEETCFPIMYAIDGYVQTNEEFRVIGVVPQNADGERNLKTLQKEINTICERKGIRSQRGGADIGSIGSVC